MTIEPTKPPSPLSWPTAVVLCVALLVIAATVLAGPSLGLDGESMHYVMGAESVLGVLVLGVMRGLFHGSTLALLVVLAVQSATLTGCTTAAAVAEGAPRVRDLTCRGTRLIARVADRTCRVTGGPWVVPRSDAELEEDEREGGPTSGGEDADRESDGDDEAS